MRNTKQDSSVPIEGRMGHVTPTLQCMGTVVVVVFGAADPQRARATRGTRGFGHCNGCFRSSSRSLSKHSNPGVRGDKSVLKRM